MTGHHAAPASGHTRGPAGRRHRARTGRTGIDRAAAERLLAAVASPGPRHSAPDPSDEGALLALLLAARGPARTEELAGEDAAVAAFLTVRDAPVPDGAGAREPARPASRSRGIRRLLGRFATLKAGLVGGLAVSGMALAAGTGVLPVPLDNPFDGGSRDTVPVASASASGGPAGRRGPGAPKGPGGSGRQTGTGRPSTSPAPGAARPDPALAGLCNAYAHSPDHGRALDGPAFQALIAAAGGRDRVDGYCAALPGNSPTPSSDDHPGQGGKGPETPGNKPAAPGGPPTAPGKAPTVHPGPGNTRNGKTADNGNNGGDNGNNGDNGKGRAGGGSGGKPTKR